MRLQARDKPFRNFDVKIVDHETGHVFHREDTSGRQSEASIFGWNPDTIRSTSPERIQMLFTVGVAALFCFRLLMLLLPLDLSGDEAYYWDWGRNLDWGYYSKPPGIAWLMAPAIWEIWRRVLPCS